MNTIEQVLAGEARWTMLLGKWQSFDLPNVDVLIADPPYSERVHARSIRRCYLPDAALSPCRRMRKHEFGFDPITPEEQVQLAAYSVEHVKRWSLVFSDTETAHSWKTTFTDAGLEFIRYGFWVKDRAMPQITGDRPGSRVKQITIVHPKGRKQWNGGGLGNVWQHPVVLNCSGHRTDRIHPAQKPLTLMLELVKLFTNPGEVLIDLYAGSGTTGEACMLTGRRFIGVEMNPEHHATCCERLEAALAGSTLSAMRAGQLPLMG